jgi:hypothetical protein
MQREKKNVKVSVIKFLRWLVEDLCKGSYSICEAFRPEIPDFFFFSIQDTTFLGEAVGDQLTLIKPNGNFKNVNTKAHHWTWS